MKETNAEKKGSLTKKVSIVFIVLVALAVALCVGDFVTGINERESNERITKLSQESKDLKKKIAELEKRNEKLGDVIINLSFANQKCDKKLKHSVDALRSGPERLPIW